MGANCPGCNPRELTAEALGRARALVVRTGVSVAHRPQARIDSGGTPPRTCVSGSMSTSDSELPWARLVPRGHAPRIARGAIPAN